MSLIDGLTYAPTNLGRVKQNRLVYAPEYQGDQAENLED
jgi:hypothetical protein